MTISASIKEILENLDDQNLYNLNELEAAGLSKMAVRRLTEKDYLISPARGVYIHPNHEPHILDDYLVVSKRSPNVIFNLYSAARIHNITQVEPNDLWIGLPPENNAVPKMGDGFHLDLQPLFWSKPIDAELGIETINMRGVELKLTNPERTVVDMWRYSRHNPSLKQHHQRITDEHAMQCLGAYLEVNDGKTSGLGNVIMKMKLSAAATENFMTFVQTYSSGLSFNRVF